MKKVEDWLNKPRNQNLLNFANEYIYLTDTYWSMANEKQMSAIETAYSNVLRDKYLGENDTPLLKMTPDQIIGHFHKKRVVEYQKINDRAANIMRKRITDLIRKNIVSAKSLGLIITKEEDLTTYQCYYNYILLKNITPTLESVLSVKRK